MQEFIFCDSCEYIELQLFDDSEYDVCPNCGSDRVVRNFYTQEELNSTVKNEKEAILKHLYDLVDKYYIEGYSDKHDIIYMVAEAIRTIKWNP